MRIPEEEEDNAPGVSFQSNGSFGSSHFSPFLIIGNISRKKFSYNKLPQEPLSLRILKLDGSSFAIQVAQSATVAELKQAVEVAFSCLPNKISWSHVWGHFCLCYDHQKLLSDSDYIGSYGIKDGDQLCFIRHLSIHYNTIKTQAEPEEEVPTSENSSRRDGFQERAQEEEKRNPKNNQDEGDENNDAISRCEHKLTHLLRGWFSYRRLNAQEDTSFEEPNRINSSRLPGCSSGSIRNTVSFRGGNRNSS